MYHYIQFLMMRILRMLLVSMNIYLHTLKELIQDYMFNIR